MQHTTQGQTTETATLRVLHHARGRVGYCLRARVVLVAADLQVALVGVDDGGQAVVEGGRVHVPGLLRDERPRRHLGRILRLTGRHSGLRSRTANRGREPRDSEGRGAGASFLKGTRPEVQESGSRSTLQIGDKRWKQKGYPHRPDSLVSMMRHARGTPQSPARLLCGECVGEAAHLFQVSVGVAGLQGHVLEGRQPRLHLGRPTAPQEVLVHQPPKTLLHQLRQHKQDAREDRARRRHLAGAAGQLGRAQGLSLSEQLRQTRCRDAQSTTCIDRVTQRTDTQAAIHAAIANMIFLTLHISCAAEPGQLEQKLIALLSPLISNPLPGWTHVGVFDQSGLSKLVPHFPTVSKAGGAHLVVGRVEADIPHVLQGEVLARVLLVVPAKSPRF